jgi:hypothetical protein
MIDLLYEARAWWWRRNPMRGRKCGDLACVCYRCNTWDCPCGRDRRRPAA